MKLWQCDWAPSSVADWLSAELDERGIPGTTYTHTILSLLHSYFCPHPVSREPNRYLSKGFISQDCFGSSLNSGQLQELELLLEEFEDHVHPDADFPELDISEHTKDTSRRSKKRQRRKLQQLSLSPEKVWKAAALRCILDASDEEAQSLEGIVEELFVRLKSASNETDKLETNDVLEFELRRTNVTKTPFNSPCKPNQGGNQSCYSSNFPPLSERSIKPSTTVNWKSLIKSKFGLDKKRFLSPIEECCWSDYVCNEDRINGNPSLDSATKGKDESTNMELGSVSTSALENGSLQNNAYCFVPIQSNDSLQLAVQLPVNEQRMKEREASLVPNGSLKKSSQFEEWECDTNLLGEGGGRAVSLDLQGNRLYQRSFELADPTPSNSGLSGPPKEMFTDDPNNPAPPMWEYQTHPTRSGPWNDSNIEPMWNSAPFVPSSYTEPSSLGSMLSLSMYEEGNHFPNAITELGNLPGQNPPLEDWVRNSNWGCGNLSNPKRDPLFSSAFRRSPRTAFREDTRQDCKASEEDLKNIWADHNDNITEAKSRRESANSCSKEDSGKVAALLEDNLDEKLCESFRQLGLEHLWEEPPGMEQKPDESYMAKSINSEFGQSFYEDSPEIPSELTTLDMFQDKYEINNEMEDIFQLPKIPSGPSGPYIELKHTESSGFSAVVPQEKELQVTVEDTGGHEDMSLTTPQGSRDDALEHNLTTQEEENLLTSPRTHFRPIRQDSQGSNEEGKVDDHPTAISGNIEDPNLVFQRTGSGTLYLESDLLKGSPKKYMVYREPNKLATITGLGDSLPESSAPPSVVNDSQSLSFVPKFKIINNEKFCQTEGPTIGLKEKKVESLYPLRESLWEGQYESNLKLIWEGHAKETGDSWDSNSCIGGMQYPKWSSHDFNTLSRSSDVADTLKCPSRASVKRTLFKDEPDTPEDDDDAYSKLKFIWNSEEAGGQATTPAIAKGLTNDLCSSVGSMADSWEDKKGLAIAGQLAIPRSPWDVGTDQNPFGSVPKSNSADLASRFQLQLEVDQEADEILAGLVPSSPLKASPSISPRKRPQRLSSDADEFTFLDFLEQQDHQDAPNHPIEDLDHLEPGWDLNDGFEWGAEGEQVFDGDNRGSGDGCDGDQQEVLVYETSDGETLLLPVEYLEGSFYDQIFGTSDPPFGGSLPDIPELKKNVSYKLSRRTRGDNKFVPPSRRPCSFFLEGNCRRSDCKFSHDLSTITCRFWEEGSCLKGDTCPFRHAPPPSRRRNRSEGDQLTLVDPVTLATLKEGRSGSGSRGRPIPKKGRGQSGGRTIPSSFELDSETDFPVLGSSVESKVGSFDESCFGAHMNVAKVAKKKKKFITVTKALFKEIEAECESRGQKKTKEGKEVRAHAKKKGRERAKEGGGECEALRKVLRKRFAATPQPFFSHDDGTVSDF